MAESGGLGNGGVHGGFRIGAGVYAAKPGPGFVAWFTAVVAALAMVKMLVLAWYPYRPDRETFHGIQQEAARLIIPGENPLTQRHLSRTACCVATDQI